MCQLNCCTASHSWQFIIQTQKGSMYTHSLFSTTKILCECVFIATNGVFGFAHVSVWVCVYMMSLNLYCGFGHGLAL